MKKFTAFVLAAIMVALCFSISVSAADTNLAKGKSYTVIALNDGVEGDAEYHSSTTNPEGLLTDGKWREVNQLDAGGNILVKDVAVELAGTNRIHVVEIDLGAKADLTSVVLKVARRGSNRFTTVDKITVDGKEVSIKETATAIADAPQVSDADKTKTCDQYFDITYSFKATGKKVAIYISTEFKDEANYVLTGAGRGYISSLDEIEVYGTAAGGSTEEPAESETPDESTPAQDSTPDTDTPDTGDAGIAVFAVLAVVSLAGVVISKKSK